jgi:cobalt/nickel transport system ATP-binding protein
MKSYQLAAAGVEVRFGSMTALKDVGIEIPSQSRIAVLGANGSGKTTLLRVLSGALKPTSGVVSMSGIPVRYSRAGLREHRQRVQLVVQNPDDQLFAADVFRDVSFGPLNLGLTEAEVGARVAQCLQLLSLEDLAQRPIHELSYGQRKRVAIAGALAMRPSVILLDEPTAGLDPEGVAEMVRALDSLQENGTTVVISTHEVDFALQWADSVAVLVAGAVVSGSAEELLADAELVRRARLRQPIVVQLAAQLGLSGRGIRDVAGLTAALNLRDEPRLV